MGCTNSNSQLNSKVATIQVPLRYLQKVKQQTTFDYSPTELDQIPIASYSIEVQYLLFITLQTYYNPQQNQFITVHFGKDKLHVDQDLIPNYTIPQENVVDSYEYPFVVYLKVTFSNLTYGATACMLDPLHFITASSNLRSNTVNTYIQSSYNKAWAERVEVCTIQERHSATCLIISPVNSKVAIGVIVEPLKIESFPIFQAFSSTQFAKLEMQMSGFSSPPNVHHLVKFQVNQEKQSQLIHGLNGSPVLKEYRNQFVLVGVFQQCPQIDFIQLEKEEYQWITQLLKWGTSIPASREAYIKERFSQPYANLKKNVHIIRESKNSFKSYKTSVTASTRFHQHSVSNLSLSEVRPVSELQSSLDISNQSPQQTVVQDIPQTILILQDIREIGIPINRPIANSINS